MQSLVEENQLCPIKTVGRIKSVNLEANTFEFKLIW